MSERPAVHYLTTGFPGPRAGSVHIGKMTSAFAAIGCPTTVVRPRNEGHASVDRRDFVDDAVRFTTLPAWSREQAQPRLHTATLFASYAAWLAGAGRAGRLDWVHVRDFRLARLAARTAGRRARVALEVHHSAHDAARVPGVHLFVAISDGAARGLREAAIDERRILVAHDAVDPRDYADVDAGAARVRERFDLGGRFVVGYTGHLYDDRGIETLVDAVGLLPEDVVLHVVGGLPSDLERVERHIRERGVGDRVRLPGPVPPSEVAAHQAAADVLVIPYGNGYKMKTESSPLKLHEYMAVGRPVIVGDLPFAREIVDPGTALLFEPDDPADLARAVERARSDGDGVAAMVDRARAVALSNTWEDRARAILERGAELPPVRG